MERQSSSCTTRTMGDTDSNYEYDDEDYEYSDEDDSFAESSEDLDMETCDSIARGNAETQAVRRPKHSFYGNTSGYSENTSNFSSAKECILIYSEQDMMPIMKNIITDVSGLFNVPSSAAAVLLREYKWNKERLVETFFAGQNKILEKCGVESRCNSTRCDLIESTTRRDCEICYEDYTSNEMLRMPCGHEFCLQCWLSFIQNMIHEGNSCLRTTCPQAGCKELVTEVEVQKAAPLLVAEYESYQLRSFVELNDATQWCPGPGCDRIAFGKNSCHLLPETTRLTASCNKCKTCFCMKCGEEPHSPISCHNLKKWKDKCKNESESSNWILANTKPCPKCQSRIEKNQGCNHMICQQCSYHFCWICMSDWNDHGANTGGYYKCNKYKPDENNNKDHSARAKAKRELDRYLHYYKRYHAHAEAQKFAKKQLKQTEERMKILQDNSENKTWADVEFLKLANEQLVECRRVLKYTYSYAFYMPEEDKNKKERFEFHQEMLERFTENLSELSERPLGEMRREDVVNQTRVVCEFMNKILEYVDNGMDE
mmetsp:Transcript_21552/g.30186  ORF Transcript_21552/g.30186 Transcript_21552/m.30186 type:complete len:542 (+) Transcript_21552:54-1679(+)